MSMEICEPCYELRLKKYYLDSNKSTNNLICHRPNAAK